MGLEAARPLSTAAGLSDNRLALASERPSALFDRMMATATDLGASDVHIETYESTTRIRSRVDGLLHLLLSMEPVRADPLVATIKVMAGLDIAEKRRPQDGRILWKKNEVSVDLRVSVLPVACGEKVVIRILDRRTLRTSLSSLGMSEQATRLFRKSLARRKGMILVTGPTGSGKTTTLYAALQFLARDTLNICTLEDPIEYELEGINQTRIRHDIGYSFATSLRAILRQDPDVIMVGEIRDTETAEIAVRAALTGHLVLSTLHTNDAVSTIVRLTDMGVPPYLIASALTLVVSQRLVRTLCTRCEQTTHSCPECRNTGYSGRTAVFELLPVEESLARMIGLDSGPDCMYNWFQESDYPQLREAAAQLVSSGLTTEQETRSLA